MDKALTVKFNLYDNIGYLFVGSIAILTIYIDTLIFSADLQVFEFDWSNSIIWLIVAYFLGHTIQAFSNLITERKYLKFILSENKYDFSSSEKDILEDARKYFTLPKTEDSEVFNYIMMYSTANDTTGQVRAFNAYYGMYRGWLVIFVLQFIVFVVASIWAFWLECLNTPVMICLFVSLLLAAIFQKRAARFFKYYKVKVLQTFIISRIKE